MTVNPENKMNEFTDTVLEENSNDVPFFEDNVTVSEQDESVENSESGTPSDSIDSGKKAQGSGKTKHKSKSATLNDVIDSITVDYIKELDKNNLPHPYEIERELINRVNSAITLENLQIPLIPSGKDKKGNIQYVKERDRWQSLSRLVPLQIVRLIMAFHHILRIDTAEENVESEEDLLGIYVDDPAHTNYGLYDINESTLFRLAQQYDRQISKLKFKDVQYTLQAMAKRKTRCTKRDLVAVNNGIFNYKTKKLEPFSPDKVFLAKSKVNYVDNPVNPVITNPEDGTQWDVETWMSELSDDKDVVKLLWQTLSCIIRPFVRWNKSVWLYSTVGNNGKGTLCALMRNLCGAGSHTSIPLSDFSKDFALQPLLHANAIIVDENNVGEFLDKSANVKAIVTNDVIQINRKHMRAVSFRFWGFMVQCVNELPRVKDKSDSFFRRQVVIPMEKCFTGAEREYIKDDYLNRDEVLEYVLWRVLNVDTFYKLNPPDKCLNLLEDYKTSTDPVRSFITEFQDKFVWNFVPTDFAYDLYIQWCKRFNPQGKPEGRNTFKTQLEQILYHPNSKIPWELGKNAIRTSGKMTQPEPLILEYNLMNWKNPSYIGKDENMICIPQVPERLRGMVRKTAVVTTVAQTDIAPDAEAATVADTTIVAETTVEAVAEQSQPEFSPAASANATFESSPAAAVNPAVIETLPQIETSSAAAVTSTVTNTQSVAANQPEAQSEKQPNNTS